MNFRNLSENRTTVMIVFVLLLILGVILTVYRMTSREPQDATGLQRDASSTRTALALTSQSLLGPFPTPTAPTATASQIPSPTWTPTRTPTRTPTSTATPVVFITLTARTTVPRATFTNTPRPPATSTRIPTRTQVPPTRTPVPPTAPPTTPPPTSYQ